MKTNQMLLLGLIAVGAAVFWFARRPSTGAVEQLQKKFVRAICETDIAEYYETEVGAQPVQGLVGPPSSMRDQVFAHTRHCFTQVGVLAQEKRSYRELVGCSREKIEQFEQGVSLGVQAACPAREGPLFSNLLTLLGVVAQMDAL